MSESEQELDMIIEAYRDALRAYVKGDPDLVVRGRGCDSGEPVRTSLSRTCRH